MSWPRLAWSLQQTMLAATGQAFVILDGTLPPIDQVDMPPGETRPTTPENTSSTG